MCWHNALLFTRIEWISIFLPACLFYRLILLSLDFNFDWKCLFCFRSPNNLLGFFLLGTFDSTLFMCGCAFISFTLAHSLLYARAEHHDMINYQFLMRVAGAIVCNRLFLKTYRLFIIRRVSLTRFILVLLVCRWCRLVDCCEFRSEFEQVMFHFSDFYRFVAINRTSTMCYVIEIALK